MSDERLRIEPADGRLIIEGELDAHTSSLLDDRLAPLDPSGTTELDLGGVTFVDSSGLRTLIACHQRFDESGGTLRITSVSDAAARLIQISGLREHLDIS